MTDLKADAGALPTETLRRMLQPRGVAVIGASADPRKRGYQTIKTLLDDGFEHAIYPINPRAETILGLPAYPSLAAVPTPVDLAFIVTPSTTVPDVVRQCGEHGVAGAVVIAVGFKELGAEGERLEREIVRVARAHGVRLIGPNTSGVFNLPWKLNLVGAPNARSGSLALLTQSGNMLLSILAQADALDAGFSIYIGVGNESDLTFGDYVAYLAEDPGSRVIAIYAEGFRDGRGLLRSIRAASADKPVVVYKSGRSDSGRQSALSHTGALAGSAEVAAAVLGQAGAVVVERSDELLPVAESLALMPAPAGPRLAVLADGGGHATVAADAVDGSPPLHLPELSAGTQRALAELLPPAASLRNPVDVAGATDADPQRFARCLELILADPGVDAVLMVGLFGGYGLRFASELTDLETATAAELAELARAAGKPLIVQSAYAPAKPQAHQILRDHGVPVHESIEVTVRCLASLWRRSAFLATRNERSAFHGAGHPSVDGARALLEPQGRELLAAAGLDVGEAALATDAATAARAAAGFGGPVALKIVSPDVVHKSDVGGVVLGVSGTEAAAAYDELLRTVCEAAPDADLVGALVLPMAPAGVELIVGAHRDPIFGPVVSVGAGGTLVEVLHDVAFRAAPLTVREAEEMLDELRVAPVLAGVRGRPPVDRGALVRAVLAVARLITETPEVREVDLNPLVAHPGGVAAVDVRVIVDGAAPCEPPR
jgi:acyl-CoA synthetase (NDP forming)